MQRNLITNFTINYQKTQGKETIASLIGAPKMRTIVETLKAKRNSFTSSQKICIHRR